MKTSVILSANRSNWLFTIALLVLTFQLQAQSGGLDKSISMDDTIASGPARAEQTSTAEPETGKSVSGLQMNAFLLVNSGKVKLAFKNPNRKKVYIELRNEKGLLLFAENSRSVYYLRGFNFDYALAGTYTLTARGAGQTCVRQIRITHPLVPRRIEFDQPRPHIANKR
jgi:hypothetical protein